MQLGGYSMHTVETLNVRSITSFVVSNSVWNFFLIIIEKNASVLRPSHALTRLAFLHHASLSFLFPHRSMYSSSLIPDKTDPVVMRAAQRSAVMCLMLAMLCIQAKET